MKVTNQQFILDAPNFPRFFPDNIVCKSGVFDQSLYRDDLFAEYELVFDQKLQSAVRKRKAEFLAGRIVAKQALAELGIENFHIASGEARSPMWPPGVSGSITHSDEYTACIVSDCPTIIGLGIDVEPLFDEEKTKLANQFLFGPEHERLASLQLRKFEALTLAFSLKEAFFKAAFPTVREYFNFDAIRIDHVCLAENKVNISIQEENYRSLFEGVRVDIVFSFFQSHCVSFCRLQRL